MFWAPLGHIIKTRWRSQRNQHSLALYLMFGFSGSQHSSPKANPWASQNLWFQKQSQNGTVKINGFLFFAHLMDARQIVSESDQTRACAHADRAFSRNCQNQNYQYFVIP